MEVGHPSPTVRTNDRIDASAPVNAVLSSSNPSPNFNEGASRVMCAVLIAENTANAHHSPQSISENLVINSSGNEYRIRIKRPYERQVNQAGVCVVAVFGWVSAGSGSSALGAFACMGFWASLHYITVRFPVHSWLGLGFRRGEPSRQKW